jgi:hypothetical protein
MTPVKFLLAMAAAACLASPVLAQGSIGGTIGQHDKSTSGTLGGQEPPASPQQRQSAPPKKTSEASCKLASGWSNQVTGVGTSVWTISADGMAVERGMGSALGHARMAGRNLTITWRTGLNEGTYAIHLDAACGSGTGNVTVTGGLMSGAVYNATFTAVPGN